MSRLFLAGAAVGATLLALASGANAAPGSTTQGGAVTVLPTFFAVVNSDGSVARKSSKVTATSHIGTGEYEVDISYSNTNKCVFVGAPGTTSTGSAGAGTITAAERAGNIKGVFVDSYDATGNLVDQSFHILITCN